MEYADKFLHLLFKSVGFYNRENWSCQFNFYNITTKPILGQIVNKNVESKTVKLSNLLQLELEPILLLILDYIRSTADRLVISLFLYISTSPTLPVINVGSMSPLTLAIVIRCMRWIWSVPRCTGPGAISQTTAGLDYQLITTTCCRKHGTFHCHYWTSYLIGLSRWHKITQPVHPIFLWII